LVVNRLLKQEARAGHAGLSSSGEDARDDAVGCSVKVCVIKNNVGRFSTKLQGHALEVFCCGRIHASTRFVAPGKGDAGYLRMTNQRLANVLTEPSHDVDHPRWEAGFLNELGQLIERYGSELGRFADDRIARTKRSAKLPGRQQERRVPWR